MKNFKWILGALVFLAAAVAFHTLTLHQRTAHLSRSPDTSVAPPAGPSVKLLSFANAMQKQRHQAAAQPSDRPSAAPEAAAAPEPASSEVLQVPEATAYDEFARWLDAYLLAGAVTPADLEKGQALAMARRAALEREIKVNPRQALRRTIGWEARQALPGEIRAYLEEVVSGRGQLEVYCAQLLPGADYREFPGGKYRYAKINGRTFRAYVYGRRLGQMTQRDVALHGIAVGNVLALHEAPARLMEAGEVRSLQATGTLRIAEACPVCGVHTAGQGGGRVLDCAGQYLRVCGVAHAGEMNRTLAAAEADAQLRLMAAGGQAGTDLAFWTMPPPGDVLPTYGVRRMLYMRVVFPDDTREPITLAEAERVTHEANDFYVEASYNKTTLITTVTPLLTLPFSKLHYSVEGPGLLMEHALEAAVAAGFDPAAYNFAVARHPNVPGFDWGGLGGGSGNGGVAWLQTSDPGTLVHELGHVYGLGHANYWETRRPELPPNPNNLPFDVDSLVGHDSVVGVGDEIEYGDVFDIMGSGGGEGPSNATQISTMQGHFNPIGKYLLGWLPDANIANVSRLSTNRIWVHDAPGLVEGRMYALRVAKDAQRTYWVSARSKFPNVPWLTNGVELHFGPWSQGGYSDMLDTTPGSRHGRTDGAIQVGRTYTDDESRVFITPVARGGSGTNTWFDLVVAPTAATGNGAPTLDLVLSTNAVRVGGSITFTATSGDPNADALSYYWEFSDEVFAPNASNITRNFAVPGDYVVRCEVSDMKGGRISKHAVFSVGDPTTLRVSGQVIDNLGNPVLGARVANGSLTDNPYNYADDYQWTYTDSDGAFTLVNLTNRTYSVSAFLNGYVTRPINFQPPLTLADQDAEGLQFMATPQVRVSATKVADANAATGNPGSFLLSRTGDTNTALTIVCALGGTAVAGEDYTDLEPIVTHTNVVPTPFGPDTLTFDFYQVDFPTGVMTTNLTITANTNATITTEKLVALTIMYPLQVMRLTLTNGDSGTLITNTNYINFSDWEIRTVNGQDTWFQNYTDYVPYPPAEGRLRILGMPMISPLLSLVALDASASENAADTALFTITRSGPTNMAVTVYLEVGGTATPDSDYETIATKVTIPAGATFLNLRVVVRPDNYLEGNETVSLKLLPDPGQVYTIGEASGEVTIGDNDLPQVVIKANDPVATEVGGDLGSFTVSRSGDLTRSLEVRYLVEGNAVSGRDYRALSGSVTIPAGQPSAPILLTPRDNGIRDGGNEVVVFLSDNPTYNIGWPGRASVFIQDRALPFVTVAVLDDTAVEPGDTGQFEITRTGDLTRELIVNLKMGGSAKPLADYASLGSRVRIPPGQSRVVLTVTPADDRFREDAEVVILELERSANYNLGANYQAAIALNDDDSGAVPGVGFTFLTSSVDEDRGVAFIAITCTANPAQDNDLTVDWKVTGGTAVPDVDFPLTSTTGRVVFPHNGDLAQLIEFPLNGNPEAQPNRTVVLTLLEPPSYISNWVSTNELTITNELGEAVTTNEIVTNSIVLGVPMNGYFDVYTTHTLTILDDDAAVVTLEATDAEAREDGMKPAVMTLRRVGPTNAVQRVRLHFAGGADPGSDYQIIDPWVEMPPGVDAVPILITPLDDPVQEFMESVVVSIIEVPGGQMGDPGTAVANVVDNDGTIEFTQTAYYTLENVGVAEIPVRRTGPSNELATVDFTVGAGTAVPEEDFVLTNGTLTFAPGEAVKPIRVAIIDDRVVEPSETIQLTLRNQTGGAPIGGQTTATLTVSDEDTSVEFTSATYRANENGTNAVITLRRIGVIDVPAQVDFLATNGTAINEVDFLATNVPVTFAAGVTSATVRVRLIDNILIETNKTILLTLATNAESTTSVGPLGNAQAEIANDDCALEFGAAEYRVKEYARVVSLDIRRLGGTVNQVTVDFATTAGGTALQDQDYVAAKTTVTFVGDTNIPVQGGVGTFIFQPGETNKTVEVRILDDTAGEGNEDIWAVLSNPRGPTRGVLPGSTTLGTQTNTTVVIVDDETPGAVDFAFNPGQGTDGPVYAVAVQPDGKLLLGGNFSRLDGVVLNYIGRLHEDGYLDSFFNPGAGPSAPVHALAVQPDGRILVGGAFTRMNSANANRITRLNADGTIDTNFVAGFGADGLVRAVAVAPDGAIVLGGDFTGVDGIGRNGIARLLADGSLDTTFDPGNGASGGVNAVAVQPDGKVLLGGSFTSVAGVNLPYLARLNVDGSVDRGFAVGTGPDAAVHALALAADGRILVGGAFKTVNNVERRGVVRLNADGSVDTGFDPGLGADDVVLGLAVQADGKVGLAGAFTTLAGEPRARFGRLNPNGTLDTGFEVGQGANSTVRALAMQPDTALILGGDFTVIDGLDRAHIARVHGDEKFVLSTLQFSAAFYRVEEDAAEATLTVLRSGDITAEATVDYLTRDGTATAGEDYEEAMGTLTFPAGETVRTFTVKVVDDQIAEGDEYLFLALTNLPTGYSRSGQLAATLTLVDNESALAFGAPLFTEAEGAGKATIVVRRTGPSDRVATVDYATADDTAVAGADYEPASGTLTFDTGVTEAAFDIVLLDDTETEADKTVGLSLTNPTGGPVLGVQSNAVLVIRDDDRVEFYSLNITPPVGGSVVPGSGPYPTGSTQTVAAIADNDFTFTRWEGSVNTTENPLTLVMDRNYNLTARFTPTQYTYTFEPPFQAAELAAPPWANSTVAPWILQSATSGGGSYALRSGTIGNGEESSIELVMDTRAGAVSFDFRVSSEANWDFLEFWVNGVRIQRWSGEVPWQSYLFNLAAGRNRLTWRYTKDANFNSGQDAAFLDNIYVPTDDGVPVDTRATLAIRPQMNGMIVIEVTGKAGVTYVLEARPELSTGVWTPFSTNLYLGSTLLVPDPVGASQPQRYYRARNP